jgi:hypothetical protein
VGFLLLGGIGGLLPTVLRVLSWARTPKEERGPSPFTDVGIYISTFLEIVLGVFAVCVLDPASKIQAVAFGYSAPEFLTRAIAAIQGKKPADRSATPGRRPAVSVGRILRWWAQ